jgi:hypothetical protein
VSGYRITYEGESKILIKWLIEWFRKLFLFPEPGGWVVLAQLAGMHMACFPSKLYNSLSVARAIIGAPSRRSQLRFCFQTKICWHQGENVSSVDNP